MDLKNYDIFIIKSATGTNKTGSIIESITNLILSKKCESVAALASRVVLAANLHGRFGGNIYGEETNRPKQLKMKFYGDIEEKKKELLCKENRLVQTPDSLVHMYQEDIKVKFPEIVFVDEIESMYSYICNSDTLNGKRREVFTLMNTYIKNAKYVFLVDSNVTVKLCNYIKGLREENKTQVIYNKKQTSNTTYHILDKESVLDEYLKKSLNDNEKLFLCTDSKTQTDYWGTYIGNEYPKLKIKMYNSDTDDMDRSFLKVVNEEWIKYDVVIVSPTVLYGVDFNREHFDRVYGYYTKTIVANSVFQQLNRIRKIKQKVAYITIAGYNSVHPLPTSYKTLNDYIFKNKESMKQLHDELSIKDDEIDQVNLGDRFINLALHFKIEENKCENGYSKRLTKYLTEWRRKVIACSGQLGTQNFNKIKSEEKKKRFMKI